MSQKTNPDLVVLGMHCKTGSVRDFFLGTTVERIIRCSNTPILIAKLPAIKEYGAIITSTDFSIPSRRAIEVCLKLSPDAHYELLHIYDIPFSSFMTGKISEKDLDNNVRKTIEEEGNTFIHDLKIKSFNWELVMMKNSVAVQIAEKCKQYEAELLVLGTHGRTGIANELLGSVAAELVQTPPCAILISKAW